MTHRLDDILPIESAPVNVNRPSNSATADRTVAPSCLADAGEPSGDDAPADESGEKDEFPVRTIRLAVCCPACGVHVLGEPGEVCRSCGAPLPYTVTTNVPAEADPLVVAPPPSDGPVVLNTPRVSPPPAEPSDHFAKADEMVSPPPGVAPDPNEYADSDADLRRAVASLNARFGARGWDCSVTVGGGGNSRAVSVWLGRRRFVRGCLPGRERSTFAAVARELLAAGALARRESAPGPHVRPDGRSWPDVRGALIARLLAGESVAFAAAAEAVAECTAARWKTEDERTRNIATSRAKHGRRYDPERVGRALALVDAGSSVVQAARACGVSAAAIYAWRFKAQRRAAGCAAEAAHD